MVRCGYLLIVLMLAACATPSTVSPQGSSAEISGEARLQRQMSFERALKEEGHLLDVSYPVLRHNAGLCKKTTHSIGVNFWSVDTIGAKYAGAARGLYGLDDRLRVSRVAPSSPAAKAGLKVGDVLLAVNGRAIPSGKKALQVTSKLFDADKGGVVSVVVDRNGKELHRDVSKVPVCDYNVVYLPDDPSVNAYADGDNVFIPRGILRFAENDTELALVVSHELAHNAMGHVDKRQQNALGAGLAGLAVDVLIAAAGGVNTQGSFANQAAEVGAQAYSVEFEQEADYVGMYFMERAGYNSKGVSNVWRRLASEVDSGSIDHRGDHPSSPERFISIEKTYSEIREKKKRGLELLPEMKKNT